MVVCQSYAVELAEEGTGSRNRAPLKKGNTEGVATARTAMVFAMCFEL